MSCRGCGVCCDLYGNTLAAAPGDLERWRREGRGDLLGQVGPQSALWHDPASGDHLEHCPHFSWRGPEHGACAIHPTKPEVCRAYPTALHRRRCVMGVRFGEPA